jgi:hypothetical protein
MPLSTIFQWRKPEYPMNTTDLPQATAETENIIKSKLYRNDYLIMFLCRIDLKDDHHWRSYAKVLQEKCFKNNVLLVDDLTL